jgi:hypothetical protein
MSDKKISQLDNLLAINAVGTDFLPIVNGGTTKRISLTTLKEILTGLGFSFQEVVFNPNTPSTTPYSLYVSGDQPYYVDGTGTPFKIAIEGADLALNTLNMSNLPAGEVHAPHTLFLTGDDLYWTDGFGTAQKVIAKNDVAELYSIKLENQTTQTPQAANTIFIYNDELYKVDNVGTTTKLIEEGSSPNLNKVSLTDQTTLVDLPSNSVVFYEGELYYVDGNQLARKVVAENDVPAFDELVLNNSTSLNNHQANSIITKDGLLYFVDEQLNAVKIGLGELSPALGYTAENTANKATDFTVKNNVLYPTTQAVSNELDARIAAIVNTSPEALNTLSELANALGNDPNFATTISTQLGQKENTSNKSTSIATDAASDTKYPSVKAVHDWVDATYQTSLGFTPENASNKVATITGNETSTTKFPVIKAILDYFSADKIRTILGISTLSGSNTGDQDLTPYTTGSGTANYVPRWTTSKNLGNGIIQDNGSQVAVGEGDITNTFYHLHSVTSNFAVSARFKTQITGAVDATGLIASANGVTSGNYNMGVSGKASGNPTLNIGTQGVADFTSTTSTNVGGEFAATNGHFNYSVRLIDGTEGTGKFLKSVTSDGKANWATITASDVSGVEASTNKDTDVTLAANSDTKYPSQKAVKSYVDSKVGTIVAGKLTAKVQINCKTAGSTLLLTTDASKGRFIVTNVWFHADTIASLGFTGPSISVGHTASNYADFVSNQALPNSSFAANQFTALTLRAESSSRISCPASTGIYVKVVTASDATTYTGTVFIEGFYIG